MTIQEILENNNEIMAKATVNLASKLTDSAGSITFGTAITLAAQIICSPLYVEMVNSDIMLHEIYPDDDQSV